MLKKLTYALLVLGCVGAVGVAQAQTSVDLVVNPATLNAGLHGVMHATILCTETFDPALVDVASLQLGPGQAAPDQCELVDTNGDGCLDLSCRFQRADTGLTCADTELTLTGALMDTTLLTGTAPVRMVPCRDK